MDRDNSNQKKELVNDYRPKVDIAHYFGYGGHDLVVAKALGETADRNFINIGNCLCNIYNNIQSITRDEFLCALKKHSRFNDNFDKFDKFFDDDFNN
jgi:hypothetical protein